MSVVDQSGTLIEGLALRARLEKLVGRFFAMAVDERYARRVHRWRGREVNELIDHGMAERHLVQGRRFLFLTKAGLNVRRSMMVSA